MFAPHGHFWLYGADLSSIVRTTCVRVARMGAVSTTTALPEITVHDRLRIARKHAGLQQVDVQRATGINKRTLSNWEIGRCEPDLTDAARLARLYGVTLNWLATGFDQDLGVESPEKLRAGDGTRTRVLFLALPALSSQGGRRQNTRCGFRGRV